MKTLTTGILIVLLMLLMVALSFIPSARASQGDDDVIKVRGNKITIVGQHGPNYASYYDRSAKREAQVHAEIARAQELKVEQIRANAVRDALLMQAQIAQAGAANIEVENSSFSTSTNTNTNTSDNTNRQTN